nr:HAD family hydrolase [Aeromicrobium camelliae]
MDGAASARELVVVTDLDGTLVEGDGFDLSVQALARRSPARRLALALVTPVAWALMAVRLGRATAASLRLWVVTVGVSPTVLDAAVNDIVRRTVPVSAARPGSALAEIRGHLADGARLVVVRRGRGPSPRRRAVFSVWRRRSSQLPGDRGGAASASTRG